MEFRGMHSYSSKTKILTPVSLTLLKRGTPLRIWLYCILYNLLGFFGFFYYKYLSLESERCFLFKVRLEWEILP